MESRHASTECDFPPPSHTDENAVTRLSRHFRAECGRAKGVDSVGVIVRSRGPELGSLSLYRMRVCIGSGGIIYLFYFIFKFIYFFYLLVSYLVG
jgi:hypothetical protein